MLPSKRSAAGIICVFLLCLNGPWSRAQTNDTSQFAAPFEVGDLFASGRYEATLGSGVLFSPVGNPRNRPEINYTVTGVQLGLMLGGVHQGWFWHGAAEISVEGFGSAIYSGPGSYVAGVTAWVRYNFLLPGSRLVPFIEGGAGLVSTDIDRSLVGQPFNFNLDLGIGARYVLGRQWSLNLEYRFQHISNADLGKTNVGLNSQGPILGVSYFF